MVQITIDEKTYILSESLNSDTLAPIFADEWTASRVWNASRFLGEMLVEYAKYQEHPFQPFISMDSKCIPTTMIELGSGCGLAGLVALSLGGEVVFSDQPQIVDLLTRNIAANVTSESEKCRAKVVAYTWGSASGTQLPHEKFDYILISDCINPIYGIDSWRNLAKSIQILSTEHTVTYLSYESRGNDGGLADFIEYSSTFLTHEKIAQEGILTLYKIQCHNMQPVQSLI